MIFKKLIPLALCAPLAACATTSSDIAPSYVSSYSYENMSCKRLSQEAETLSAHAAKVFAEQDQKASNDKVATGAAVVLFWPALFFIGGDKAKAAEVAKLKGEMSAIETVNKRKNCGIEFAQA